MITVHTQCTSLLLDKSGCRIHHFSGGTPCNDANLNSVCGREWGRRCNELCTKNQTFPDDPFHHTCHQVLYMKPSFLCLGRYQAQSIWRGRLARVAAESGAAASKLRRNAHGLHHRRQHFANATLRAAMQLPFTISRRCRERRWDFHKINFNSHYDQIRYVVQ